MTPFEHIMITGSIVLGLAIAQLLKGFTDSLRVGHEVKMYWPHTVWVLIQLMACIQWGFGVWVFEARTSWAGYELCLFIFTPIVIFIVARFMYPHPIESVPLKEYYFKSKAYTFGLTAAITVKTIVANIILRGMEINTVDNLSIVVIAIMLLTLAKTNNELSHKIIVPILMMMEIFFMVTTRVEAG